MLNFLPHEVDRAIEYIKIYKNNNSKVFAKIALDLS